MTYKPYIVTFACVFIGMSIVLGIIRLVFPNFSITGVSVTIPFFSALVAAEKFVKLQRRIPNETEKLALTHKSFIVVLIYNFVIAAIGYLLWMQISVSKSLPFGLTILIVMIVFLGMQYLMMRWAYGGLIAKRAPKILARLDTKS